MPRGRPKGYPKTGGNVKGSQHKKTKELKEFIQGFLEDRQEDVIKAWQQAEPAKQLDVFSKLAVFIVPKQQDINLTPPKIELILSDFRKNLEKEEKTDAIEPPQDTNTKQGDG